MPYSNIRKIAHVEVVVWTVEGEYHEDTQYYIDQFHVVAVCDNGERFVHEVVFSDSYDLNAAKARVAKFVERVEERGYINLKHWYFHEYFSLTFEQKLDAEYQMEQYARKGQYDQIPNNGIWGDYHA